ncbi:phosphate transport system permease protein [Halolactibacillus halophilus]|uniref:Phosphate transport system permease protein PstA n=1 Tax=Halolactibacillus halophilus TaxID=306540 RepID=A0A1I5KZD3_9BACI|nr:phosphate ABC transporter permease PstA [Halolactibacillus halophilus]GEM00557.1 phosphate ABC transporter, permease protein PstA [Halolactibacillus halophilus]SFO89976.1 phosphate transport system permease protein [Halolactibacillus halophilus]
MTTHIQSEKVRNRMKRRVALNKGLSGVFLLATMFGVFVLAVLFYQILTEGMPYINLDFLTGKLSTMPERAGIMGAILGTLWLMAVVIPVTIVLGVGTAIYNELYAKEGKLQNIIQTNISNLSGVPSIVYGILGMTIFASLLKLGSVVLAGGLTMSLLVLPIVIVSSQEALRAVPSYLSEASIGLGATKWQTIKNIILPAALPGILTGAILALSRAIGETAPLVVLGIPALLLPFPGGLFDRFTVLPMQIYYWTLDASLVAEYQFLASATIIVLLAMLFILNGTAIVIRNKFQRRY